MDFIRGREKLIFGVAIAIAVVVVGVVIFFNVTGTNRPTAPAAGPTAGATQVAPTQAGPVPSTGQNDRFGPTPRPETTDLPVPSYQVPPGLPVSDAALANANRVALQFLDVFGNSRFDDAIDVKITKIKTLVSAPQTDVILQQYTGFRATTEQQQIVTYTIRSTQWSQVTASSLTLLVQGTRTATTAGKPIGTAQPLAITLIPSGGTWVVSAVNDPRQGDVGAP
jgi:hypothetical protein